MDELLASVLGFLIEALAEFLLQFALEALLSSLFRALDRGFSNIRDVSPVLAAFGFVLLGAAGGELSVFVFPHPLFHPTRFHGISLLVSPLATGFVMSQVGRSRRRRGRDTVRLESFGYGFVFALAMALVRFVFVA